MSPLRKVKDTIVRLAGRVDQLDEQVRKDIAPKPTETKRIPMFESVGFVFPFGSTNVPTPDTFRLQERSWTNGADDAYITEISYSAYVAYTYSGSEFRALLWDSEAGLFTTGIEDLVFPSVFDFEWNYRRASSGQTYGTNEKGGKFLSRKSLGNKYRSQMLRFTDPEMVNAGDALAWMIRPTLFYPGSNGVAPPGLPGGFSSIAVVLNVVMIGYRDGAMAEGDYELK